MAKLREFKLSTKGAYKLVRVCEDRKKSPNNTPKKITHFLANYLPFDDIHIQTLSASNMFGMKLANFTLKSGQVYDSYDGKRLIYEVGCNTVIYSLIKPNSQDNYSFYLQGIDGFAYDVTTRSVAAKVVKATAPIKTIVKYEMYFLLGLASTVSLPALILVVGTDIAVTGILAKAKMDAAKKFSQTLLAEHKTMASYAPTLHAKIEEFISSNAKIKLSTFAKQLPETIVKDEKTQAQLSGVLVGKATLAPKAFTVWTAIFTILMTAGLKSVTKSPEAYAQVIDKRYRPILDDLQEVDWNNPAAASQAATKFKRVFKDAGIEITDQEALAILMEVIKNPDKLDKSLRNIDQAFREFKLAIED